MLADLPLPEPQQHQMGQLLARMIAGGTGQLDIIVEKAQIRWLRPVAAIYNPSESRYHPVNTIRTAALDDLIGPLWWPTVRLKLAELLGHGWGRLTIYVDHHQVQAIHYAPDVQAIDCRIQ